MDAQELRKLLEKADNKLSVFASVETLNQYSFNNGELLDLVSDFLSDEEKIKLFDYSHFKQLGAWLKGKIIGLISDEDIKLQLLNNDSILSDFKSYEIINIIKGLSDTGKQRILRSDEIIKKYNIDGYELKNIISSLTDEAKVEILSDKELVVDKLHLSNWQIADLIKEIEQENAKSSMLEVYSLENHLKVSVINTYSNESKVNIILEDTSLRNYDKLDILSSLDGDTLSQFIKDHKEFCEENGIKPYEIITKLDSKQQLKLVTNLEDMDLTLNEKREILATLKPETKQNIDTTNFPEEYKTAIAMKTAAYTGRVILDMDKNLEDYRGLDSLLRVNPEEFTEDQRAKFMNLCDICPNLEVVSVLNHTVEYVSTAKEYKEAESWIASVIDSLKPEYSKAQKMAVIDNAIGKKISYSPDFDTEISDGDDCRALWRIVSSGYGVCNGIAKVEQYMLNRVGIESEFVGSGTHAFLKIKNIELPLESGELVTGNTILDPTWNLTMHRFGARPDNFCMSYEEARKRDIDIEGKDHKCHKNDEQLEDATLNLDEQSLRQLFTSVGLADKEGQFPVKKLLEESELLHETYANEPETNINKQFLLLKKFCPEFASCQNRFYEHFEGCTSKQ